MTSRESKLKLLFLLRKAPFTRTACCKVRHITLKEEDFLLLLEALANDIARNVTTPQKQHSGDTP